MRMNLHKLKDCILICLLTVILLVVMYINALVFIQGGPSKVAEEIRILRHELEVVHQKDILYIDRYPLNEVVYVFQIEDQLLYLNQAGETLGKSGLVDENKWIDVGVKHGLSNPSIRYGYDKEPVIGIVDERLELVFSLENETLLIRHER